MNAAPAAAAVAVLLAAAWWRPHLVRRPPCSRPGRSRPPRRRPPSTEAWAELLDHMAAEVRAGMALSNAFHTAVTHADPQGEVVDAAARPGDLATAVTANPDEAVVVQTIATAASLGGPVAATLQSGANLLRERAVVRAEAVAHSAQARLSARVLTAVPVVFAGWSTLTSRSFRAALTTPAGMVAGALGVMCNLAGWWWMRRIVGRAAP